MTGHPEHRAPRGGVALVAALWLVVAMATVGMLLGLETRAHRAFGAGAAERAVARAAAAGALARTRAHLERALRRPDRSAAPAERTRAADPWLDADSLYSGVDTVGGVAVEVRARDLGALLDVNEVGEDELRAFLAELLGDRLAAEQIAEAVLDWRDADDDPRPRGAEREQYERQGRLVLPAGADFRDVDELRYVVGMTPERFAVVRPHLTTRGSGRINVNSAPEAVLRALPGAGEDVVARILAYRAQGRRITTLAEVLPRAAGPGRPNVGRPGAGRPGTGGGGPSDPADAAARAAQRLAAAAIVETQEIELTLVARAGTQAAPVAVRAVVRRAGTASALDRVTWE